MTPTQKRYIQVPLFLLIVFAVVLPFETAVFSFFPLELGPLNILTTLLCYLAITRPLPLVLVWGLFLGLLTSLMLPFGFGPMAAACAWGAMGARLLSQTIPVESGYSFAILASGQLFVIKLCWRAFVLKSYHGVSWIDFAWMNVPQLLSQALVALVLLPLYIHWDYYFENIPEGSSDLMPRLTGIRR